MPYANTGLPTDTQTNHSPVTSFELAVASSVKDEYIIQGPLVQIDVLNKNEWGVGRNNVGEIINQLAGIPIRKCNGPLCRIDEHASDYQWNQKDDVGKMTGGFVKDGWIWGAGSVTDPIAVRKLSSGTWDSSWSIFLGHSGRQDSGYITSPISPFSVSLVKNPAYDGAVFSHIDNEFTQLNSISGASTMVNENEGNNEADMSQAGELSGEGQGISQDNRPVVKTTLETKEIPAVKPLTKEDVLGIVKEALKEAVPANKTSGVNAPVSKELDINDMVPRAEVDALINQAVATAQASTINQLKKEKLVDEVASLRVKASLDKPDNIELVSASLMNRSFEALNEDKMLLEKVLGALDSAGTQAVEKFKETALPGASQRVERPRVGRYVNGNWE
jgi:hypothetical protein